MRRRKEQRTRNNNEGENAKKAEHKLRIAASSLHPLIMLSIISRDDNEVVEDGNKDITQIAYQVLSRLEITAFVNCKCMITREGRTR